MMVDAILSGASMVFAWPAIGLLFVGIAVGLCLGIIPGLSGLTGMSILLPFTFGMDTGSALAFLMGMFAVTTTSDTLSSVLLGVPGTAASQATVVDGYPMAQKGEAARAFGAAFTVSAVGGVLGALVLAVSVPVVRPLIMSFAAPEFVMLGLLGLTMIGSLSGGSMLAGLAAAALGLLVSMVGYAPQGATARYTFDVVYLFDGIPLVPVVLGLFAIPEMIDLTRHGGAIASGGGEEKSRLMDGVRDAIKNWWLVLRCSALGSYVGMLPGLGGAVVDWIAYGHAVQTSKDRENYGKGDVRGVIAPEAANNAAKGGALVPTLAFGIPGSPPMAILLGAFLIQGLTPGPRMLTDNLDVTFSLVIILMVANVVGAGVLMIWSRQFARLADVPGRTIVPLVALFVLMGAWMSGNQMGDWITLIAFGVIGLVLKRADWSRPAFILGFIIGPIIETSLHLATQVHGVSWVFRPVCVGLGALLVLTLVTSAWREVRRHRAAGAGQPGAAADLPGSEPTAASNVDQHAVSLAFGLAVTVVAVWAAWTSLAWPFDSRYFPLTTAMPLALFAVAIVARDALALRAHGTPSVTAFGDWRDGATILWLTAIPAASFVFPQPAVLTAAVAAYVFVMTGGRIVPTLVQGAVAFAILTLLFGKVGGVLWFPSIVTF